jgi:hypothetical protein
VHIHEERVSVITPLRVGRDWDFQKMTNGKIDSRIFRSERASRKSWPEFRIQ